jgi:hypothetical protein
MGQVVSVSQHQATRNMQIKEAEKRAKEALHQASLAYRELGGPAMPIIVTAMIIGITGLPGAARP